MADPVESDGERRWRLFLWLCAALRGDRPEWPSDPADTQPLIALAGDHFVTPTLAIALDGAAGLPGPVREYLAAVELLNRDRNALIFAAVDEVADCLAARNIPAVFLKGTALVADGLYADPAERFVGDIDVLVPAKAAFSAAQALVERGFSDKDVPARRWVALRHHHLPCQRHVESGVGVEIHQSLLYPTFEHLMSSERAIQSAVRARSRPDILILEPRQRALHAILHDQLSDAGWRNRRCGLRALADLARITRQTETNQDWSSLPDDLPSGVRPMLRHMLSLAGLLGAAADPVATERACRRLRHGMSRYTPKIPEGLIGGVQRLLVQPAAIVNLLNPLHWPERIRRIGSSFSPW